MQYLCNLPDTVMYTYHEELKVEVCHKAPFSAGVSQQNCTAAKETLPIYASHKFDPLGSCTFSFPCIFCSA